MRPTYIVLRQSPDWAKQTYADLDKTRSFCRIIGRPETYIIDRVLLWDKTFGMSFFSARQIIKDISIENFKSVHGAELVSIDNIHSVLDRKALYLFTDDDDWYHPGIARHLSRIDPRSCDAVLWQSAAVGSGLDRQDNVPFYTNGYAVSGEVLCQKPGNVERITQHFEAQATFIRKSYASVLRRIGYASLYRRVTVSGFQSIVRLPEYLSITNKHAASTFTLTNLPELTSDKLVELIQTRLEANKKISLPEDFSWARIMIARVNAFMEELLAATR